MPGQRRTPNPRGLHLLAPAVAAELVRTARVGPDELVLDLGAGTGALTRPLARTGARVLAVERAPGLARRLRGRFAGVDEVRVVEGDMCAVPLPRRSYRVVANLPFSIVMSVLGRLLDPPDSALRRADLVVPWHLAVRVADPRASRRRIRAWHRRYSFHLGRRLPRGMFQPPPTSAAGVLVIERRRARS